MSEENILEKKIREFEQALKGLENAPFNTKEEKEEYLIKATNWINEIVIKNTIIRKDPKKENVKRIRQSVYWMDFGVNVGTEFNYPHFCVVIKEFGRTAIVVPLSTEKNDNPEWKSAGNLFIKIGKLKDLPGEQKECYALVNQIRTVSKQRLSNYKHDGKFISITLDADQMKLILDAISSIGSQKIKNI